jgi:uncharacterized Zn finger protein
LGGWGWKPYIPAADRREKARRELEQRRARGEDVAPVVIEGRSIVNTFWGKAWCENLEHYSDFANRLPRGRTYVRNGSVVDLKIGPGAIDALVSGSSLYKVALKVTPVTKARWKSICNDCSGGIDSLVELLQGRLSKAVMERICRPGEGLFPAPSEIQLKCSCPDWAAMCKHVAAVLYGIGARFDSQPELVFTLRGVDAQELIAQAGQSIPRGVKKAGKAKVLAADEDLSALFGLEIVNLPKRKYPSGSGNPRRNRARSRPRTRRGS